MIIVAILLKASLVLAVAILPGVLFRKRLSATSRHLLWTLAVVGLLVVPVLHAVLDVRHSQAWNEEVIGPLVEEDPRRARCIAEGAVLRLTCGARCFDRYRAEFGLS